MSLGGLLNIGTNALNATQSAIATISNNIANVNTTGYSRQYVVFEDASYLNGRPGGIGQGVNAKEVERYFNKFVENAFVGKSSVASRWNEESRHLSSLESIFNEVNRAGISSQMNSYFGGWESLSTGPDDMATRQSLISQSDTLALLLRDAAKDIKQTQRDMDAAIKHDVIRANELIESIAEVNSQINSIQIDGVNNANGLMDKRDSMARELGLIVDVKIDDKGGGNYSIQTKAGMPLVLGTAHFELAILPPRAESNLGIDSEYKGEVIFSGSDAYEYTIHMTQGGDVTDPPAQHITTGTPNGMTSSSTGAFEKDDLIRFDAAANLGSTGEVVNYSYSEDGGVTWISSTATTDGTGKISLPTSGGAAVDIDTNTTTPPTSTVSAGAEIAGVDVPKFKVSLDGGKTFLRDDDNKEIEYVVTGKTDPVTGDIVIDPVKVKNLEIAFSKSDDFTAGDEFTITPKEDLYWIDATKGAINITPQISFNGADNESRLTGGTLTALFNIRDDNCGRYLDELDAVTSALIWETNYAHSQGAGLEKREFMFGTESAESTTVPIGTPQSGLAFHDKITKGDILFNIYNKETGTFLNATELNFNDANPAPVPLPSVDFDPEKHSMQDIADAVNRSFPDDEVPSVNQLKATIVDGKLSIESNEDATPPVSFHVGADTTGVLAATGLNTFFEGSSTLDIAINPGIYENHSLINAGSVNGGQESNPGDATTANILAKLATKDISISTVWKTGDKQNLSEYYSSLVATVGSDTRAANTSKDYNIALASDLDMQQASLSGVNLDQEMANLIKFQHSYTAAAKLITTADQMLQTLLGLKQ